MNKKNLFFVALTTFCLVSTLFMTIPALAGTSAPPIDLYGIVKDIQTKVNTILTQLSALPSILTALENKLWSASDSVKNDTLAINAKLENVTEMESLGVGKVVQDNSYLINILRSKPFKVTITVAGNNIDSDDTVRLQYSVGNQTGYAKIIMIDVTNDVQTYEFVTEWLIMYPTMITDGCIIYYDYTITYGN